MFSRCIIHIICFQGLEDNLDSVLQPVVLLRYFAPNKELFEYAFKHAVEINNKTFSLQARTLTLKLQEKGHKYVNQSSQVPFRVKSKKIELRIKCVFTSTNRRNYSNARFKNIEMGEYSKGALLD